MGGAVRLMCLFFVWASESLWVVTPPHLCSHLVYGRFVLSAARIWKHVVGTNTIFDKPVSCKNCRRCFVRCVLLNGCESRMEVKAVLQPSFR